MATKKQINHLKYALEPKSVAIVGASRTPNKIGHVLIKNLLDGGFSGKIYPVNPNAKEILGLKCYPNVTSIPKKVDLAVISIPARYVNKVLDECGRKGVKATVVITAGFAEVGNYKDAEQMKYIADKYDMALIGPNCMGILNPKLKFDSIFLPTYKLERPKVGRISFISQSGAVGGCLLDLIARAGVGISKFISYGNATVINETDLLEYLKDDDDTDLIACYIEGVKDGKRFLNIAKKITPNKPIIMLKSGKTDKGRAAAKSHTGTMAGSMTAYRAAFRQAHIIEAQGINDLYHFPKMFVQPFCTGKKVAVLTNGGGNGVMVADAIEKEGLELAEYSNKTKKELRRVLPSHGNVGNPLDILGDADSRRYEQALSILMEDDNVDAIIVIILFQTASIDSSVAEVIIKAMEQRKKPIIVVSTGGEYTNMHRRILDSSGVTTYRAPMTAVQALARFVKYNQYKQKITKKK